MTYPDIRRAVFLERPNRFIAHVELDGRLEVCHVKNTGRCRELLVPGATVWVQEFVPSHRKTRFDLISVLKGDRLINMDSAVPNKVFAEWVRNGPLFSRIDAIRPEHRYGSSRFDFCIDADGRRTFVEVKGVTLEENGVARFPDAPTERGIKHLRELADCVREGYGAVLAFIVQMKDVLYVEPNRRTHSAFGEALSSASAAGVRILALDCRVTPDSITAADFVEVRL